MKIGIIGGTGKQGSGLAIRWAKAGHEIVIGSRDEARATNVAKELNAKAATGQISGSTYSIAAEASVVVLALPFEEMAKHLSYLEPSLRGKVVLDISVNLKFGKYISLQTTDGKSSYEMLRDLLPQSNVVACFKTISSAILHSGEKLNQSDLQMGTNDESVEVTKQLAIDIGLSPIRVVGKFHAQTIERLVALLIQLNKQYPGSHTGIQLTDIMQP